MKDQINSNKIEVKHCPTDDMTSDYMSKPLVGAKFYKFKSQIMNLPYIMHDSDDQTVTTIDSSECNMSDQFFQISQTITLRVHFCKFHAIVQQQCPKEGDYVQGKEIQR